MQKKWLVVSCIALLVGILATAALAGNPVKLFVNGQKSMIKDENEQEEVVRLVEDFGRKLKSVSLLAPQETVNKSVQENYGDFIAPALLAEWQKDLQKSRKAAFKSVAGTYRDFKRERASRVRVPG